ncbi:hypothetical protein ACHAXA_001429 [Cyclostephanos tholiformis]|uniref:Sulfotransferase domain-containing protein n=1 Tax=Cyclostephanos tholiformis TaxID=382380 RepID=A0ABD3RGI6_9STRA
MMLLHRNTATPSDDQEKTSSPASSSTICLDDDTSSVRRNRRPPALVLMRCFRKTNFVFFLSAISFTFYFRAAYNLVNTIIENQDKTPGFMVLGMHRSGTSMLSGLLVEGFGYDMGQDKMKPSFDNEKGFYERNDVVLQNDEFLEAQRAGWSSDKIIGFDPQRAYNHKLLGRIKFKEGKKALKFLNKFKILPYLQKDPRMCITLTTWLKLLDDEPAIVFTYRHPLEVALSLKSREAEMKKRKIEKEGNKTMTGNEDNLDEITMERGFLLWITYNMRALQNSMGLCRVFTTNEAVYDDPAREVQRIKDELTTKCNVIPPPRNEIPIEVVNAFVDPRLQHNKKGTKAGKENQKVLKDFGKGCVALDFVSDHEDKSSKRKKEINMYLMAMQVYCDMERGLAYTEDYKWPDLAHWQRLFTISSS